MLTYDDNQRATKAHCRLAFSAQPQRLFLPLLVGLHGSTDTTARKSAIIEKKNFCKNVWTINFTVPFYLHLYLHHVRSVSFSNGGLRDLDIIFRDEMDLVQLYFVSLAAWLSFRHAKLTAGGEGRVRILAVECVCFFLFFPLPTALAFFAIKRTHSHKRGRCKDTRKGRKETESSSLHSISGLQIDSGRVHLVSKMTWSVHRIN